MKKVDKQWAREFLAVCVNVNEKVSHTLVNF